MCIRGIADVALMPITWPRPGHHGIEMCQYVIDRLDRLPRTSLWNYSLYFLFLPPSLFTRSLSVSSKFAPIDIRAHIWHRVARTHILVRILFFSTLRAMNVIAFIIRSHKNPRWSGRSSEEFMWCWGRVKPNVSVTYDATWFASLCWRNSDCFYRPWNRVSLPT